jgi:LPS sulfotransferase NodH
MTRGGITGRVFIVGVPRSGTTLLQALLAAHDNVTSFTESHLFDRHFTVVPGLGPVLTADPTPRLVEFLTENDAPASTAARWFGPPPPRPLRRRMWMPLHTRRVASRLVGVLDELAAHRKAPIWLEKTPLHLRSLPLLERVCDDGVPTRFVHVVRDGIETVASLYRASRHWERAYELEECVSRWNRDLALTVAHLGSPGHLVVLYEKLTADPEAVLRHLLAELDLDWQPGILTGYAAAADGVVATQERWKDGVGREIRPSATAERVLDAGQRERVAASLRRDLYDAAASRALGGAGHE